MAGLTVTEKEHWKSRIARRIDKKIEALSAADPNLFDRIHRQARQQALQSLGLADLYTQREQLEQEKEALEKRIKQISRALLARIRGVPVEDVDDYTLYRDLEVTGAIERRQKLHEDELLAETEIGREILRLRQEQEELTDVVWLATSPREIKTLWAKVSELLGDDATRLQQEALAIAPVEE